MLLFIITVGNAEVFGIKKACILGIINNLQNCYPLLFSESCFRFRLRRSHDQTSNHMQNDPFWSGKAGNIKSKLELVEVRNLNLLQAYV